ncbi:MAG: cytochrome c [Marinoscillum sp.]|jgi:cytochrome c
MKKLSFLFSGLLVLFLFSCGGGGQSQADRIREQSKMAPVDPYEVWERNHGIGPIKAFELLAEIDQSLVTNGQVIYEAKCTACHKVEKKFIGPSPQGILSRRTPAWVMNMILNPDEMIQKDPIAKKLLMESNGSPMANQNLTEEEARSVLEYFRTL